MAKQIECGKFLVIECTAKELREVTHHPIVRCDWCNDIALSHNYKGFYIAVLNQWYCKKCFEEWKRRARYYPQDAIIEKKNFDYYASVFSIKRQ